MDTPTTSFSELRHDWTNSVSAYGSLDSGEYANQQEGHEDTHPFGLQPEGLLIYTPDGIVSAQLMRPGRSLFQSTDWNGGTAEEYLESGSGYIAYCGLFEVDEEKGNVTHIPSVALVPNLIPQRQVRSVTLAGDKLTLRANGDIVTSVLNWRKVSGKTNAERNKAIVLEAFDTLFNKRDYAAAAHFGPRTTFNTAPISRPDEKVYLVSSKACRIPSGTSLV